MCTLSKLSRYSWYSEMDGVAPVTGFDCLSGFSNCWMLPSESLLERLSVGDMAAMIFGVTVDGFLFGVGAGVPVKVARFFFRVFGATVLRLLIIALEIRFQSTSSIVGCLLVVADLSVNCETSIAFLLGWSEVNGGSSSSSVSSASGWLWLW